MQDNIEIWDAYDKDFNKIEGRTIIRGERIEDSLFHMTAHVIVKHVDGTFLLMKRANTKHFSYKWELTAGGCALQGEDAISCAKRELEEETGLTEGKFVQVYKAAVPERHFLCNNFLFETNCDKDSIRLQEGETMDFKWASREEILNLEEHIVPEDVYNWLCEQV